MTVYSQDIGIVFGIGKRANIEKWKAARDGGNWNTKSKKKKKIEVKENLQISVHERKISQENEKAGTLKKL